MKKSRRSTPGSLILRSFAAIALGAWLLGGIAATPGDSFLDAREAFRLGEAKKLARLAPELKKHDLAAYVDYFQLRMDLETASGERIAGFLNGHAGEYVGEKLRADWARLLAKQERWGEFETAFADLQQPDAELSCQALRVRRLRADAAAGDEARTLWANLPELPEGCLTLMRELADAGGLDAAAVWTRVGRQLEANRVGAVRTALSFLAEPPDGHQIDAALDRPEAALARLPASFSASDSGRKLAIVAVQRLARQDPRAAAATLRRIEAQLDAADRAWAWAQIGWQGAQRHLPEALDWYRGANAAALSDEAARWQVRAALRAHDWPAVRHGIEAMPAGLAGEPAWIYWLGRAYKAGGRLDDATMLFAQIADSPNFYGNLAAEELGRPIEAPPRAAAPTVDEIRRVAGDVAIRRALKFYQLGLRFEGTKEWAWALRNMDDRHLLAAAEIARRNGIYDRAINAADKTRNEHDYGLRYLAPFDNQVRPAARAQALDDAWVYGLMRQESRFVTDARSAAGASGLMQLMPATARWVARKIGLKAYNHGKVNDTAVNLMLGTSYLRLVLESLDHHPVLASAAYNAGPGRARRWRDPERPLEGAIYAETIPFSETRDYVKKVMSNAVYYSVLFNGRPDSLKARLGTIGPRPAEAGEALP